MRSSTPTDSDTLIYLIAGEESGDRLGGRLMQALREMGGDRITFAGIGGATMQAEGLSSLFPMEELSVMGLVEVVPRVPRLLRRIGQTVGDIMVRKPAVVVGIDAPDFCFRVEARVRAKDPQRTIRLVHYVAPTVWAWRPGRARKIARFLDHLLTLYPFEAPYFEREGLATTFVGHPLLDAGLDRADGRRFRNRHGIAADVPVLTVLPGSRRGELDRLLPILTPAMHSISESLPSVRLCVPTLDRWRRRLVEETTAWPTPPIIVTGDEEKYDAFAASNAAIAASGTVALELGLTGTPAAIVYRMAPTTAFIARRLIRTPYANLVNIILDRPAVPELLQENATPDAVVDATHRLLANKDGVADDQRDALSGLWDAMRPEEGDPARQAASTILGNPKGTEPRV